MIPPFGFDVGLECRSKRSEIIETGDSTIDLEGLGVEELSLQQIVALLAVVLLLEINWLSRRDAGTIFTRTWELKRGRLPCWPCLSTEPTRSWA